MRKALPSAALLATLLVSWPTAEPSERPHEVPELEALLPEKVLDQPLARWSVRGRELLSRIMGLTDPQIEDFSRNLSQHGYQLDDVMQAVAGRISPDNGPPYIIIALRIGETPAVMIPRGMGLGNAGAGEWAPRRILGRPVHVGTEAMVEQNDHQQGRPYVYNLGPTRFLIISAEEPWAADAIRQLPEEEPAEPQAYPRPGDITGKDGSPMVSVPAGEFLMGSAASDEQAAKNERPQHTVKLEDFYIDKYEVTNGQYRAFLAAIQKDGHGSCEPAEPKGKDHRPDPETWTDYRMNMTNQPVVGVDWYDASSYCRWAGKRLPTEAEWEKAARGKDGRTYPWGNEWDPARARSEETGSKRASEVGSFPGGASPYGAEDMAGNVWEWVHDWYGERFYEDSPRDNPSGPESGEMHVVRGCMFMCKPEALRATFRNHGYPTGRINGVGFRCAKDGAE